MRKWPFFVVIVFFLGAPVLSLGADTGKALFQQKCASCHTVGEGNRIGPDLLGVTKKREQSWLIRWIAKPDQMLAEKDPVAVELLKQFNQIPMPNLGVSDSEVKDLITYLANETEAASAKAATDSQNAVASSDSKQNFKSWVVSTQFWAFAIFLLISVVIAVVFWQVALSTRNAVPSIDMKTAYALRKKLFFGASMVVLGTLGATLPFSPYPVDEKTPDQLVYVAAKLFSFSYSSEPITSEEDFGRINVIDSLRIPVGALVEFRVTSLDATHGFAIYAPDGSVFAQTQAMPGYVNRLRVRFPTPGKYNVLCLEYCGAAHHLMRSAFIVE